MVIMPAPGRPGAGIFYVENAVHLSREHKVTPAHKIGMIGPFRPLGKQ
jgi:hypothetical protein